MAGVGELAPLEGQQAPLHEIAAGGGEESALLQAEPGSIRRGLFVLPRGALEFRHPHRNPADVLLGHALDVGIVLQAGAQLAPQRFRALAPLDSEGHDDVRRVIAAALLHEHARPRGPLQHVQEFIEGDLHLLDERPLEGLGVEAGLLQHLLHRGLREEADLALEPRPQRGQVLRGREHRGVAGQDLRDRALGLSREGEDQEAEQRCALEDD